MKTVGEILKETRLKQEKTLDQVSQQIKVPVTTLLAIERNDYTKLPPEIFIKGFIRNYALNLDLEPEKLLAVFRRDHQEVTKKGNLIKKTTHSIQNSFIWSPQTTAIAGSLLALMIILGFFGLQLKNYFLAPPLEITSPQNNQVLEDYSVVVKGKTLPDATVFVNDELANIEFDGSFSYDLKLLSGENIIKIKTANRKGKEKEIRLKVIVDKKS